MALSREQLHRVIDHLPENKLPALADLIDKLIDDDDEPVSDTAIVEYKRIRQDMRQGDFVSFDEIFGDNWMYSLIFSKDARKFIDKQTAQTKQRIRNALLQLAEDPFSNRQVKRLKGTEDILKLWVGDFRVVFSIEEEKLVILVISIGSRGDIYNRF